jgi:deoxycytidylate deaminase
MPDSIQKIKYPELVFGFVAPIGADLDPTLDAFREYYQRQNYRVVDVKVTDVFNVLEKYVTPELPLNRKNPRDRYITYIAYGNQLRAKFDDTILAATTIRRIMTRRLRVQKADNEFAKTVFLLHQFKRKEEVDLLRTVYGRLFFQISIYSRRGARVDYLSRNFSSGDHTSDPLKYRNVAEELIQKDENEVGQTHGQRVATIFHDADFIINLDALKTVDDQVARFNELVFGSNCISPTKIEYGMFLAKAAALRTLDLSRQVGAAIFSETGEILALGSNEVPKAGGGTYWSDDNFDDRDFLRGVDSNQLRKRELLTEVIAAIDSDAEAAKLLQDKKVSGNTIYGRA